MHTQASINKQLFFLLPFQFFSFIILFFTLGGNWRCLGIIKEKNLLCQHTYVHHRRISAINI